MKKLSFLIVTLLLMSCGPTLYQKEQESLQTGIRVDTTMFNVCFNDDPETVQIKLLDVEPEKLLKTFEYRFLDERIHEFKWVWDSTFSFHNDSLINFRLITANGYPNHDDLLALEDIFSAKYSEPYISEGSYYWFKGNLEINVSLSTGTYPKLEIRYRNLESYFRVYNQAYKSDENFNTYSKDYWEKNCKPQYDKELEEHKKQLEVAGKDI
ncbi:hypothetical protein [Bacteroides fragilis]